MNWLDAQAIIDAFGNWVVVSVVLIVFFETAFIPTSFLPGDSLLFLTGLTLATSSSIIPAWLGFLMVWLSAVAGSQLGFWLGLKIGPPLFQKDRNFILNHKVLEKTHSFFDRYGARAVILARFVPILRALIPMLAGISKMESRRFLKLNLIGATIWVGVFMGGGYWLGGFSVVKENLETSVLIIVIVTSIFLPLELLRDRLASRRSKASTTTHPRLD